MNVISPDWPAPANILAFTTTRNTADGALESCLPDISRPQIRQVHGAVAVEAAIATDGIEADAIHTSRTRLACSVVTADCLPILLCSQSGDEVAAVHAGWRGLAGGVIEQTLLQMKSRPDQLIAWIGPAISQACYEVGGEVRDAFLDQADENRAGIEACFAPRAGKFMADLPALARVRLAARGIVGVFGGNLCTFSDSGRFHSYRRDGAAAGRMTSLICRQA